jgi:hypothetical protein
MLRSLKWTLWSLLIITGVTQGKGDWSQLDAWWEPKSIENEMESIHLVQITLDERVETIHQYQLYRESVSHEFARGECSCEDALDRLIAAEIASSDYEYTLKRNNQTPSDRAGILLKAKLPEWYSPEKLNSLMAVIDATIEHRTQTKHVHDEHLLN